MDHINASVVSQGSPVTGGRSINNLFVGCAPGQSGTAPGPDWFNGVQMEILSVIMRTGQSPIAFNQNNESSYTQLFRAIELMLPSAIDNVEHLFDQSIQFNDASAIDGFSVSNQLDSFTFSLNDLVAGGFNESIHNAVQIRMDATATINHTGTSPDGARVRSEVEVVGANGAFKKLTGSSSSILASQGIDYESKTKSISVIVPVNSDGSVTVNSYYRAENFTNENGGFQILTSARVDASLRISNGVFNTF